MGGWDPETTTNRLSISNIARIRRQSTGASDHNWLPGPIHKRKGLAPRMGSKTHSNNGAPASVTLVVTRRTATDFSTRGIWYVRGSRRLRLRGACTHS